VGRIPPWPPVDIKPSPRATGINRQRLSTDHAQQQQEDVPLPHISMGKTLSWPPVDMKPSPRAPRLREPTSVRLREPTLQPPNVKSRGKNEKWAGGRDESVRQGAGSQWIVAARPLCHLQCPVAYLSRLQKIQPAIRVEEVFRAVEPAHPPARQRPRHGPVGALRGSY
jgi:hypothetical protein